MKHALVFYPWEFGMEEWKPHPFQFSLMLESLQWDPNSILFVGDNPDKDCRGAHCAGMKYVQIQSADTGCEQTACADRATPEFTIDTLFQLPPILRKLNGHERN
jgi:FMN phosphatase YigB (HAD superfamily)